MHLQDRLYIALRALQSMLYRYPVRVAAFCAATIVGLLLLSVVFEVAEVRTRGHCATEIARQIDFLRSEPPQGIHEKNWNVALDTTGSCVVNTFFASDTPLEHVLQTMDEFPQRANGPREQIIDWLWHRIESSGSTGRRFAGGPKEMVWMALGKGDVAEEK